MADVGTGLGPDTPAGQAGGMARLVAVADALAERAHAEQVDKVGEPYIAHPRRVAGRLHGDPAGQVVGLLHDVLEDTDVGVAQLAAAFPPEVVAAVVALTRVDGEDPVDYYARVRRDPLALRVKLADIADNTDPARSAQLDAATRDRLADKYRLALRCLTGFPPDSQGDPPGGDPDSRRAREEPGRREVAQLVAQFGMELMPVESTYFVSSYRSPALLPDGRHVGTAIIGLYSVDPLSHSLFHRLTEDEMWHFYGGDPLRLILLHPDGTSEDVLLGADVAAGQRVQFVVPAGTWQAGEVAPGGRWSLYGCTLAPGFSGEIFTSGYADVLLADHPDRRADIERLAVPRGEEGGLPTGFV